MRILRAQKGFSGFTAIGIAFFLGVLLLSNGCDKDLGEQKKTSLYAGSEGVFVMNEGSFMGGNGDITFYDRNTKLATQNLFFSVNSRPPGDLPVFMVRHENDAWIVVNNSNTIEIVGLDSFRVKKTISGLDLPKHLVFHGDKAFVSQLGSAEIVVVDTETGAIKRRVEGFKSSDRMVIAGGKLFVANWTSWYINKPNNTVMVFDATTELFIDSVSVTKEPNSMVTDTDGMVWVLSSGGYMGEEYPALQRINPHTLQVITKLEFPSKATSPSLLCVSPDGKTLYYIDNDVYKFDINDQQLPTVPFIAAQGRSIYGLGVDPETGEVYLADAVDFQQEGSVYRYTQGGVQVHVFKTGINPSGIFFNKK
jgi:hypothetical protein